MLPGDEPEMLWDWLCRERAVPLVGVVILVEIASVWLMARGESQLGYRYLLILLSGLQHGALSCLGLWLALRSRSCGGRVLAVIIVFSGAMLVLVNLPRYPVGQTATLFAGHVLVLSAAAYFLSILGAIPAWDTVPDERQIPRFSLRRIFLWTTIAAATAYWMRDAEMPHSPEIRFRLATCPLLALAVVVLATHVNGRLLRAVLSLSGAFLLSLVMTGFTLGEDLRQLLVFHLLQVLVLLVWISFEDRAFRPAKHVKQ